MRKISKVLAMAAGVVSLCGSAFAQQTVDQGVQFTAEVVSTCAFTGSTNGAMILDGATVSTNIPGTVDFTSNGGAFLSVATPSLIDFPTGYDAANFGVQATITDPEGNTAGSPGSGGNGSITTASGDQQLSVTLDGASDQNFVTGSYTAEVIVTCEFGPAQVFPGG